MTLVEFLDHLPAFPEAFLLLGACALMIGDLYVKSERRAGTFWAAQAILAVCFLATIGVDLGTRHRLVLFNGLFVVDHLANLLKLACYLAVSAALVYSRGYLAERNQLRGEFVSLLLFSLLGMMILISANSFLTLYLGLELMSLCLYALVALNRDSAASTEAAMKYFVLGALSSGLLLYGMSMIYGATGSLSLPEVAQRELRQPVGQDARPLPDEEVRDEDHAHHREQEQLGIRRLQGQYVAHGRPLSSFPSTSACSA